MEAITVLVGPSGTWSHGRKATSHIHNPGRTWPRQRCSSKAGRVGKDNLISPLTPHLPLPPTSCAPWKPAVGEPGRGRQRQGWETHRDGGEGRHFHGEKGH